MSTASGSVPEPQRPESFWESLAEEVNSRITCFLSNLTYVPQIHGLRDVVESGLGHVEQDSAQAPDPAQSGEGDMAPIGLLGLPSPSAALGLEKTPCSIDPSVQSRFCQVYLSQVDPIIKILHRPSLESWMIQGKGYFGYPDGHPSLMALSSAVCFVAASSLTEGKCQTSFQTSKSSLVSVCRRQCEVAIERSGLLSTRDINVLQAFVLYLVSSCPHRRTQLTITSMQEEQKTGVELCGPWLLWP